MIAEIQREKTDWRSSDVSYLCVIGGVPGFRFSSDKGRVEDLKTGAIILCEQHSLFSSKRVYEIPGVAKFEIGYRTLDKVRPSEDWPTPFHQYLVLGPHRFSVDPFDGHLSFEWSEDPRLDFPRMIFAFNLASGYGNEG